MLCTHDISFITSACYENHASQEADLDIQTMAKMQPEEVQGSRECKKRKVAPDPSLSTPRPRKISFTQEASEAEEDEPHVPTPTSSPEEEQDTDGEDNDIFEGRFCTKDQRSSQQPKASKLKEPVLETPPSKKPEVRTPGTQGSFSKASGSAEELQELLAGIDDKLLALLPEGFSRPGCKLLNVTGI